MRYQIVKTNTSSANASLTETGALSGILSPGYFFLRSAISGFNEASKAASSSSSSFFFSKKYDENIIKVAVQWFPRVFIKSFQKQNNADIKFFDNHVSPEYLLNSKFIKVKPSLLF